MLLGGNSSTVGFTDRCRAAAEAFGPGVMTWLSSAGPQDAARYPNCVHLLRLDNWMPGESPDRSYVPRISPTLTAWRDVPNLVAVLGNEPDLEVGHHGEEIAAYAAAVRVAFPGVKIGNPPLSVEQSVHVSANGCDAVLMHSYFERQHPESASNWQFGASYQFGLDIAAGRPVYVTEFNVVQTNCPIDWPDRNAQAARWLDQAEANGVAGVCFFILDGVNEWVSFDVGPEAAKEIISLRAKSQPEKPPQVYTRDTQPMHTGAAYQSDAWLVAMRGRNPAEADRIVATYGTCAAALGYDGNLMIAQGWVETAGFTSSRWHNAHNAAGIGIYSDGTPDVQFGTVERGIQAQAGLLSDYFGDGRDPWGVLGEYGFGFDTPLGKVTLRDLDGVWAADTGYSAAIVAVANSVTGGVVGPVDPVNPTGIPLTHVLDIARAHIGHTLTDEGNPEFGMCEQFVEEVLEEAIPAVPRVRYPSAAVHGDALIAAGAIRTDMPPPAGSVIVFGRAFDPNGHICFADTYPFVITTYRDNDPATADEISRIDGTRWYGAVGYLGWYLPQGIGEEKAEVDMLVEGHLDPSMIERLWYGAATKTARKRMAYNPQSDIGQRWKKELMDGHPLGAVQSGEETDAASGRIVQYYTNGAITFMIATGETFVN